MAKQFDSGVVVIDGCVEQLMEMIAMPSVLLLRLPVGSDARVNTQAKGTLAKDTLCRNSFEQNLTTLEITFEPKCC